MKKKIKTIYLDHAAATPLDRKVFTAMKPFILEHFFNPSALYDGARKNQQALAEARAAVAEILHTNASSIYFTRGGTESINLAVLGCARKYAHQGKHIISTRTEHTAVLETLSALEEDGFNITYLPVDLAGNISLSDFKKALRKDTILVTFMYVNNEIGTIHPIADIGKMILSWRKEQKTMFPFFHTDACQATNYLPLSVEVLHIDLLSLNGAKIYGPKSAGILYKRRGIELAPILFGGGHEGGVRPGTEDVAACVGMAKALQISEKLRDKETKRICILRDYFWQKLKRTILGIVLNGPDMPSGNRLANNLNISFIGAESETIIIYLDAHGIAVASGAACSTDSDEPSHVLRACGLDQDCLASSIRFTLGRASTKKDMDIAVKKLSAIIKKARDMKRLSA
jgi:cysteine desulfurase